ncbi:aldo/keto reductase [Pedobacter sp. MR22-3]|uniref:aldo/keto reductase n=1 Tax=Pedobacter sp. MR22-3 TaxID=2994552 RepID=UPI0022450CCD|nr:aldo/keto reductase [Pedobacter sp. MR22-3]MCX2585202.1 aldo/keto reductase [Pedobacter sp. MR22-3]
MNLTFKLGDIEINRMGYGAMQLTGQGVFGEVEDRENAKKVLQAAVANGVNFIDTAEAYGPKFNELLIADALHPYPSGLLIATKGGFDRTGPNKWVPNGHPDKIKADIEGSLERLNVKQLDLWQLHRIDPNVDVKKTLAPVIEAVKAGKIKHVGLSEVGVNEIKQVQDLLPVASVQNMYNLGDRKWEDVLHYTAEQGLAFIPWFPLASGPTKLEDKIKAIAAAHQATTAQIALAWLLQRSDNILLIPGTKSIAHLEENLKAADINLSAAEFETLSRQ